MTTKRRVKVKAVKAWAILRASGEFQTRLGVPEIFERRWIAADNAFLLNGECVVRVTIRPAAKRRRGK